MQVRDGRTEAFHALEQDLARRVDLFLAGQEQKDVPFRLREVYLHHGDERGVHVILARESRGMAGVG